MSALKFSQESISGCARREQVKFQMNVYCWHGHTHVKDQSLITGVVAKPFLGETHMDNIKKPSSGSSANIGCSHRNLSSTAFSPGCLQPVDYSDKLNLTPHSLSVRTLPLCSTVYNKHVSLLGMGWEGLWLLHSTTQTASSFSDFLSSCLLSPQCLSFLHLLDTLEKAPGPRPCLCCIRTRE